MFFLDPKIPVLTDRGYIPASSLSTRTIFITRSGEHEKVAFLEEVELFDKASRLSWYGSGEPFYIHSSSALFGQAGILNFHQPDIFTTSDKICTKFGFGPESFRVSSFDGIDEAFYSLIKLDTRRIRACLRNRTNIIDNLNFQLYCAQTNSALKVSKFLLGLFNLGDDSKSDLIKNLSSVCLRYNDRYIIHFPNIYDAYNFVELLGRFNLNASVFKFRDSKYSVYFDPNKLEKPRPRRYFKKFSSIFSSICQRRWVVVSTGKNSTLIVAGVPINFY